MTWLGARLFKHTVVAATIFGSTVLAPFLLLLRKQCGETCIGGALVLLTAGSAALLGAAACRGLDRGSMSTCKWRLVVASVWVFNPVPLAAIGLALRCYEECFLENGSLPVVASHIIPKINQIRNEKDCLFDLVVLSQDYHPAGHISFGTAHGMPQETPNAQKSNSWRGAMSMKCIVNGGMDEACCPLAYVNRSEVTCNGIFEYCPDESFYNNVTNPMINGNPACTTCRDTPDQCFGMTMDLWLDHCLQDGDSAIASSLVVKEGDVIVQKGHRYVEMFSAFMDNTKNYKSALDKTLKDAGVTEIYAAGIATTHCVRWTVEDAANLLGYQANIIMDASAGIWGTPTSYANEAEAIADFQRQNITVLNAADILAMTCADTMSSANVQGVGSLLIFLGALVAHF
ncbi:Nicotinamidase (Nicotinamide deamidase) (NAMase) (Pyrazinamidase) (PZAase) [Durusdinium trenchii]|uniref:nicotinamidase n=1 Tax=Durusdinium trenchii TaxID=1381693 RepID=A0ABP0KBI1_9DINO